ncbi:MAG: cell division protein FtsL [Bacilli bacterium]|nr:cell division protein FtsL [Bacilli bacterium]
MYLLLAFLILAIPVCNVLTQALLSQSNIEVSKLQNKIEKQAKTNESLNMQINELASLENIKALADELGLSYNNNNIKSINE